MTYSCNTIWCKLAFKSRCATGDFYLFAGINWVFECNFQTQNQKENQTIQLIRNWTIRLAGHQIVLTGKLKPLRQCMKHIKKGIELYRKSTCKLLWCIFKSLFNYFYEGKFIMLILKVRIVCTWKTVVFLSIKPGHRRRKRLTSFALKILKIGIPISSNLSGNTFHLHLRDCGTTFCQ